MKLMLRLRDLRSGEAGLVELAGIQEALTWLAARPAMTEVLGVVFEGLSRDDNDKLKAAMRPLDDAERARVEELDAAVAAERARQAEARQR
ncbi:MAG TPA: hypothetical protein VHB21_21115, partial [Minicystis sp.]|nr:hypothetical protein [Minicystis sp.]